MSVNIKPRCWVCQNAVSERHRIDCPHFVTYNSIVTVEQCGNPYQALAAAQQAQYEAGAAVARHYDAANRWQARAEAAEAALSRGQEVHSKRYGVLAGEIADLRTSERDLKAAL